MHALIILALTMLFVASALLLVLEQSQAREEATAPVFVQRVIDGDTLVLASGERIRLVGIDAPEKGMPCFEESKGALHALVSGKAVEISFGAEKQDRYGRLLAYVFVDGNFVNLAMLNAGLAVAFPFAPNLAHAGEFALAEQFAREQGIGCLWVSQN